MLFLVDVPIENIMKKWKNIRDSYMRVRANVRKKSRSGASAEEKIMAEKLKKSHKHFELLSFLEDSLTTNR